MHVDSKQRGKPDIICLSDDEEDVPEGAQAGEVLLEESHQGEDDDESVLESPANKRRRTDSSEGEAEQDSESYSDVSADEEDSNDEDNGSEGYEGLSDSGDEQYSSDDEEDGEGRRRRPVYIDGANLSFGILNDQSKFIININSIIH